MENTTTKIQMKPQQDNMNVHIKKVKQVKRVTSRTTGIACIPSGQPDSAN